MKYLYEIEEEMKETTKQIGKINQMDSPNSETWLRGFITGLNWVLTGNKD